MNFRETREALLGLREKVQAELNNDAALGMATFKKVNLDQDKVMALAAIDILENYLQMEQVQADMDAIGYTDEELAMPVPRHRNMMGTLIEAGQIKLTPTKDGKGAGCLAFKEDPKENGCIYCPYWKLCFGSREAVPVSE